MFQELYFYRWPVETKYKELKSRLAMEEFSGATTISVFQEFYINMLLSNLSSLIKNQADEDIFISANSSNKHRYQANRAFIIGRMKKMLPKILCGFSQLSAIDQVFEDALRCRSQVLPGRTFRRKKSHTKGRSHFNNKKIAFWFFYSDFLYRIQTGLEIAALIKVRLFSFILMLWYFSKMEWLDFRPATA